MNSLRDQFSAASKAQFDAQFDFFNSMTTQALESASRLAALNLAVSRDSVQRSLGVSFALMNSRDPRDVLTLGGQAEEQMRSLFSYSRELLGIASGVRPYAVRPALPPSQASQLAIETVEVVEHKVAAPAAEPVAAPVAEPAPTAAAPVEAAVEAVTEAVAEEAAPAADPAAAILAAGAPAEEPVVVAEPAPAPELLAAAEPVPVAEQKAIAKAAGKGAARAAAVPYPAAAPVAAAAEAEVPKLATQPASSKRRK